MKERGILMSAPMVKAYLAGLKSQTRRIVKPQPGAHVKAWSRDGMWKWIIAETGCGVSDFFPCPYGAAGDRLWFREAWRVAAKYDNLKPRDLPFDYGLTIMYEAGGSRSHVGHGKYQNYDDYPPTRPDWAGKYRHARFLPRAAARIVVELTEVRVQRLQEISGEDSMAEGIDVDVLGNAPLSQAKDCYRRLWDSINGDGAWGRNDFVWALSFPRYAHP